MTGGPEPFHPELAGTARWLPRGPIGPWTLRPIRALSGLVSLAPAERVTVEQVGPSAVRVHRPRQ